MKDQVQTLAEYLANALIHENVEQFIIETLPHVMHNPDYGIAGYSESEAKLFLRFLFASIPFPGDTNVKGEKLPGRNEPCLCGSGKKFKACCIALKDAPLPPADALLFIALSEMTPDIDIRL